MTGFDRFLVAAARAVQNAWRYGLPSQDLRVMWSRSCDEAELHAREAWLDQDRIFPTEVAATDPDEPASHDFRSEIWAAACRDDLAKVEALIAEAAEADRLQLQALAAPGLRSVPVAWRSAIVERAIAAATEYDEGTLTEGEGRVWTWARAAAEGQLEALIVGDVVAAGQQARELASRLRAPPPRTDDGQGVGSYARERIDGVLARREKKDLSQAMFALRRLGLAGRIKALRLEIDRLEAAFGADAVAAAWRSIGVLAYYPGRSASLVARLDELSAIDSYLHIARGLYFDGLTDQARALAERGFALQGDRALDAEQAELAAVLFDRDLERTRLAAVLDDVLATIPEADAARAWMSEPLVPLPPALHARSPELEAQAIDDDRARAVYGDWLSGRGDPRGELIALELRGWHGEAELHRDRYRHHFVGSLAAFEQTHDGTKRSAFTWSKGFIATTRLGYHVDAATADRDLVHAIDALLSHPSGALLRELTLTIDVAEGASSLHAAIEALARHELPALRTLRLGELKHAGARSPRDAPSHEISWAQFGFLAPLWPRLTKLEELTLHGSLAAPILDGIDLPALRSLRILTGGMAAENLRAIVGAAWPKLEVLELWFGKPSYGCTTMLADVRPMLETKLPALRTLGLCNAEFTDALVEPLAASSILPQLTELSLALGTLSDDGAARLAARARAFAHLEMLDLEVNYLTDDGLELVATLCKNVRVDDQQDAEGHRYSAVGE